MSRKKFEFEGGVQKIKDKYKDVPEDVMHDIWIAINDYLNSGDPFKEMTGESLAKKYYLTPDGKEYK